MSFLMKKVDFRPAIMNFVEVSRAFHYFCLELCSNHDHFDRFQKFCSTLCDLRAFQRSLKISGIRAFLLKKVDFRPPSWILWRCTGLFITFVPNYAQIITILVDFRHFAQLCVTLGPLEDFSKLAELWYFWCKRSILSRHYGFCGGVQ